MGNISGDKQRPKVVDKSLGVRIQADDLSSTVTGLETGYHKVDEMTIMVRSHYQTPTQTLILTRTGSIVICVCVGAPQITIKPIFACIGVCICQCQCLAV